jgi:hypothetical protein
MNQVRLVLGLDGYTDPRIGAAHSQLDDGNGRFVQVWFNNLAGPSLWENAVTEIIAPGTLWRGSMLVQVGVGEEYCDVSIGDAKLIRDFCRARPL